MPKFNAADYSWGRPNIHTLKSLGVRVVSRYLSYQTNGKNLTRSEAEALSAIGIEIISNFEDSARRMLMGKATGQKDAREALRQHKACGGPDDAPIMWSIDFDASPSELDKCWSYLEGVASVTGWDRIGVYGGYRSIDYVHRRGIRLLWSTYAWSGGRVHPATDLYQWQNNVTVAGALIDKNEIRSDYVGSWLVGQPSKRRASPLVGLSRGAKGEAVKALQYMLRRAGFDGQTTGEYDAQTATRVRDMRRSQGTQTTGGDTLTAAAYEQLLYAIVQRMSR